jgi:ATP-dependent Clp protease ATP-binding subunit ClpA
MDSTIIERIGQRAKNIAQKHSHEYITLEHLLESLLEEDDVVTVLEGVNCDIDEVKKYLEEYYKTGQITTVSAGRPPKKESPYVQRVIQRAVSHAMMGGRPIIYGRDILVSLMSEDNVPASHAIKVQEITELDIKEFITHSMSNDDEAAEGAGGAFAKPGEKGEGGGKMTQKKAEGILAKFTINYNERAKENKIDPLVGREEEVFEIVHTLSRKTKPNCAMIGNSGVGKTAIVEGLAKLIVDKKTPAVLHEAVVYELNVTALIAGTRYRGDFEERMNLVVKALEFLKTSTAPILFIDEIHMIMGAGAAGGGSMDVANIIKPAIAKGSIRVIGATTFEEWRKHFEKDKALVRRFQKVQIDEPSVENTIKIINGLRQTYETFHGVILTEEAIEKAVKLSARFIHNRFQPDKAIDVIDAACTRAKILKDTPEGDVTIRLANIEKEIAKIAKIPENTVSEDDVQKLSHVEQDIKLVVFGQEKAIETVVDAVIQSRAGLRELTKPQSALLFAGPTGVGKTLVAQTLANTLGIPLVRFDMAEFGEKHTVSKLIGSPPGYVGYDDGDAGGGLLINELDQKPHCVLLFDEVEKAHPDIYNVLLGLLDTGMVKSSNGKEVSARNCYVIMTTNAGAADAEKSVIGFGNNTNAATDKQEEAIKKFFKPEFRNRLDEVVYFGKLTHDHILLVVDKFINELNYQLTDQNVEIRIDTAVRDYIAEIGFDPLMGARPLARTIKDKIKKPLSRDMLFGGLKNGGIARFTLTGEGKDRACVYTIEQMVSKETKEAV